MAEVRYSPGRIVWHELYTRDVARARTFYGSVVGWTVQEMDLPDIKYPMVMAGDVGVGGIVRIPDSDDFVTHWNCYISVPDVDAAATRATELGGTLLVPPTDIAVGRFCTVMDPLGGVFSPYRSATGDGDEVEKASAGMFCWDQLNTPDPGAVAPFYEQVLGWKWTPWPGEVALSSFMRGGRQAAAMMTAPAGVRAHWLAYIQVTDLAGSRARVVSGGGGVMVEEIPVPGMGSFSVVRDPEGAVFALFQPV